MNYRKEIDGLRALAIIPVILFHSGYKIFNGGFIGVDIFFVISGYLITTIILIESSNNSFRLTKFYESRLKRILPTLFLILIFCLPFVWIQFTPSEIKNFSKTLISVITFTSNFVFWRTSGYFDKTSELNPLLHTWTLAIEMQFYFVFPIIIIVIWKFGSRFTSHFLTIFGLISFSFAQYYSITHPYFAFYMLPTRSWELFIGALVALNLFNVKSNVSKLGNSILSFIGLISIIVAILIFDQDTPSPSYLTLLPTLGAALVIYSARDSNITGRLLSNKLMIGFGKTSYSAYLWHHPIFAFARNQYPEIIESFSAVLIALTFIVAYLSWKFIETPFRTKHTFPISGILLKLTGIFFVFFLLIGFSGFVTNGFLFRFSSVDKEIASIDISERGKYVDEGFFLDRLDKRFVDDGKRKILLIGDSYAKDLANAIFKSKINDYIQLSTHTISAYCGNLYQKFELNKYISAKNIWRCKENGWYEGDLIRGLIVEADEIWLASNWEFWVAEKLNDSIAILKTKYQKKITVFGIKDFGKLKLNELLKISNGDRIRMTGKIPEERLKLNNFMVKSIPAENFIDLISFLCNNNGTCPLFDEFGNLITYDGIHLTESGARLLGSRLDNIFLSKFDVPQKIGIPKLENFGETN